MKYDDFDKVESVDYPNENVVITHGKYKKNKLKFDGNNAMDIALGGVFFATSFALVLLFTSVITMAVNGNLTSTLLSIFS